MRWFERITAMRVAMAAVAVLACGRASAPEPGMPAELDAFIANTVAEWQLPGAAIAIVKDGKVVAVKGYGVRELGKPDPVDGDTIFDAASLTKSFTAAAVATLVDDNKAAWDDPVRRFLPALEFPDPYLTANVTLRDLLCHRTGVRPTNSAWYFTHLARPELVRLVGHMELAAPFRTRSVYWNIGYAIVGEAAAAAAGLSWEELVTQRLIRPLGLARTIADYDRAPALGNVAAPHAMIAGVQRAIPRETARASTAPAGAIQSSARDLATWLLFQLGDGTFEGKRLISAAAMAEMHAPQVLFSTTQAFRDARRVRYFAAYGFGWQVFDYRGSPFLWHTGGGDGQAASMAVLPELGLGVVVLVNSSKVGSALNLSVITSRVIDHYMNAASGHDDALLWLSYGRRTARATTEERALEAAHQPGAQPSAPLAAYAGTFRDRLGLDIVIGLDAGALSLQYGGGEPARLEHWHHDTFRVRWSNPWHDHDQATQLAFTVDAQHRVTRLHLEPFGDPIDAARLEP